MNTPSIEDPTVTVQKLALVPVSFKHGSVRLLATAFSCHLHAQRLGNCHVGDVLRDELRRNYQQRMGMVDIPFVWGDTFKQFEQQYVIDDPQPDSFKIGKLTATFDTLSRLQNGVPPFAERRVVTTVSVEGTKPLSSRMRGTEHIRGTNLYLPAYALCVSVEYNPSTKLLTSSYTAETDAPVPQISFSYEFTALVLDRHTP